jgi:predicted GNAT family acetyltransferase
VGVELLREALDSGRPYHLITTPDLRQPVLRVVEMPEPRISRIYEIELARFEHQINVLVVAEEGLEGRPRFLVRSGEEIVAEAGVTWMSPQFAAVHADATVPARERGLGEAVLAACTRWVVRSGRHPLVIAATRDEYGTRLAEQVGYVDSGARELASDVVCCL